MSEFELFGFTGQRLVHVRRSGANISINTLRVQFPGGSHANDGVLIAPDEARRLAERLIEIADEADGVLAFDAGEKGLTG